ncbi:MAG: hypothetical protein P8K77_05190 [Polaribacter sp.]|nr:hypothetical protein [Polaribacter sp.]
MKTKILLATAIFLLGASVQANNKYFSIKKTTKKSNSDRVITFTERGILFHVFLNGDFDFNALPSNTRYYNYNRRRTRTNTSRPRIYRDYYGRVNRIGSISIAYDHYGNVKRIGYIRMKYRYNQLVKIGHLRIGYRYGIPKFYGHVKHPIYNTHDFDVDFSLYIDDIYDYNHQFFYGKSFRKNYRQLREDRNYYYYKSRSKKAPHKIIKRRKPTKRKATKRKILKRKPVKRKIAKTREKRRS